jgi:ribosomal protein S18 acetylase RimI-like enzyme
MIVRSGRQTDAAAIARLIDLAGDGLPMLLWGAMGEGSNSGPLQIGRRLVESADGPYSYRHARVAIVRGQVAAAALGEKLAHDLPPPGPHDAPFVRTLLELQGLVRGTYMISNLATFSTFRRQGCATALLQDMVAIAQATDSVAMSLIVAVSNENAVRFYIHHGFNEKARRPIPILQGFRRTGEWSLFVRPLEMEGRPACVASHPG